MGEVTFADIKKFYNAHKHPRVRSRTYLQNICIIIIHIFINRQDIEYWHILM